MSDDVKVTVDGFTVSYACDIYNQGCKSSSFVSMSFKTSRPVSPEEALVLELKHSSVVTRATYYNALARGLINKEDVKELIDSSEERHQSISSVLDDKLKETKPNE